MSNMERVHLQSHLPRGPEQKPNSGNNRSIQDSLKQQWSQGTKYWPETDKCT
jgi:hypothetical protein